MCSSVPVVAALLLVGALAVYIAGRGGPGLESTTGTPAAGEATAVTVREGDAAIRTQGCEDFIKVG